MEYRIANDNDISLLAELNAQMIQDEGHQNKMSVFELEQRMKDWLEKSYQAVIFEDNNELVAYVLYREADEGWEGPAGGIYIRHFFVVRHRRREQLGTNIFAILRNKIWNEGCRITLEVLIPNNRARAFWEALGFREYCITYELHQEN